MKDVAKLALYFIAVVIVGALLAPFLFWSAQSLAVHGVFSFLARYDFETFFHRAVLIAAALLLWPFLRISHVRGMADLGLAPNPRWGRDLCAGALPVGDSPALLWRAADCISCLFISARLCLVAFR